MSRWAGLVLCIAWWGFIASPAHAQSVSQTVSDPDQARLRVGSFSVSPSLRMTNVGWDSNVFNASDAAGAQGDTTAAVSPLIEGWVRLPRVRASLRGQWDYYYFRRLSSLRALDTDQSGRIEVTFNRLTPFVSGTFTTTRHRHTLEIDALAARRNDDLEAGVYARLTAKTSLGVYGGRSHIKYARGSLFQGVDLAESLNHTGTRAGVGVRYAMTPLTTFNIDVVGGRDRFELSPQRNSKNIWILPSVEFKPFALISGRASYGFRQVTFSDPRQPTFKSSIATVDLQYSLRNRTQFSVGVRRDLEYSYLLIQTDYLATELATAVSQRLGERWDLVAGVSRYGLSYRRRDPTSVFSDLPTETIISVRGGIGYYFGRNRAAVDVEQWSRDADVVGRGYGRTRVMSSFSYAF